MSAKYFTACKKILPAAKIIVADNLISNTTRERGHDSSVLKKVLASRLLSQLIQSAFNRNDTKSAFKPIDRHKLDNYNDEHKPENIKYIAYVPHLADYLCNLVVRLPNCVQVNYFEEGTLNYINVEYQNTELTARMEKALEITPELKYSSTGINFYRQFTSFHLKDFANDHPYLNDKDSLFYGLTKFSYPYESRAGDKLIVLDTDLLKGEIDEHKLVEKKKQAYLKHPELGDPQAQVLNVIVFEGIGDTLDGSKFYDYCTELVQQVIARGIKYAQYKFHPLSPAQVREKLREKLVQLPIILDELDDSVSLELECVNMPHGSLVLHGIQSSSLLYAKVFGQDSICYNHILAHDPKTQQYREAFSFKIEEILTKLQ
ncbi:hypothetical protein CJP74_05130 [Psittacicella melopsittaci]|uniref:Uncharacterized protein n=1 Tax=Psittacicella melopsittaci TaxID=2028576 RepID=A0A3A1Y1D8_9GAMM|nr:hypothetical protein [Psittacicella melopsittaci]RIY32152.1 hypothetical protein CJP74_05130 [Psittacicella melopsittaci]